MAENTPVQKQPARRPWHRVYFLLAFFDVLVVAFGLTLNHRLLQIHTDAVRVNEVWEQRLDRFLDLSDLAAAVNAPGNDVFDSGDVAAETDRLEQALTAFDSRMVELRSDVDDLDPDQRKALTADLDAVDAAMSDMVAEARSIFGYTAAGRPDLAGSRMASMDRRYHRVNSELTMLRKEVGSIQRGLFADQARRADTVRRFEYLIAAFVLVMIGAATAYGHRIRRELDRHADELDRHLAGLEGAQAELQAARDELEARVAERTRELANAYETLSIENEDRMRALESLSRAHARLKLQTRQLTESNRDLLDFAHVASHDLQEPLRKILAFSDRLTTRCAGQLDATGVDYLERMRNASTRMQTLIDDLLTFSRVQTGGNRHQRADLDEIVAGVLSDLEVTIDSKEATIEFDPLPTIEADPAQMRQLFQNLIGNALKFQQAGVLPLVTIDVEDVVRRSDAHGEQQFCQITLSDNGIGFEPQYAEKIFTVFQRLHGRGDFEGSGIGLSVARRVVERHFGSIEAVGRPGEGATFVITLPYEQPANDDPEDRDADGPAAPQNHEEEPSHEHRDRSHAFTR